MARARAAAIPPTPRKTLLEWIESDDGDTNLTHPVCSTQVQALHARILHDPRGHAGDAAVPLEPPPGLRLAPIG